MRKIKFTEKDLSYEEDKQDGCIACATGLDHGIYENEGICGCPDPERRSRTDPQCGGKQYHTGYRNRYRELSYLY